MPVLAWNSYLTNKFEANGALILLPLPPLFSLSVLQFKDT